MLFIYECILSSLFFLSINVQIKITVRFSFMTSYSLLSLKRWLIIKIDDWSVAFSMESKSIDSRVDPIVWKL